jgi:hypothetical protein
MTAFGLVTAATFLAASAAPTPIYRLYQEGLSLSPLMLTMIFASYAISLLVALLTVGSLSDHIGRRPVIFTALLVNVIAMGIFIEAHSATTLIVARVIQGFATGAATTALAAAILDVNRTQGPLMNSLAPFAGLTAGSLGSSTLVTFAPDPTHLVFVVLLVISALEALVLIWMPETGQIRPGALASLQPHLTVPAKARSAFLRVTPVNVAAWALGGFNFSLMPSLVRIATGATSPLVGGLVVTAMTFSATLAIALFRATPAPRALMIGTSIFAGGVAVALGGLYVHLVPVLLFGMIVAGFGFGAAFVGAVRTVMPLAVGAERAGLLSAFYVECYVAFSVPAILVGLAVPVLGLPQSTYIYGAAIILLAISSLIAMRSLEKQS